MPLFCSAEDFLSLYRAIQDKTETIRLQAKGGSMFPFIRSGDWVIVSPCRDNGAAIHKGDIVLFTIAEKLYMHRVIRQAGGSFITKGDQSVGHDGVISRADILGTVVSVERAGRMIDFESAPHRILSVAMADASGILQHLFLTARKAASLGFSMICRIQDLRAYRSLAKKLGRPDCLIREAHPDDEEDLRDLLLMGGHDIRKDIAAVRREGFWLVALRQGRIVGSMTVTRYERDPTLWVIFGLEVKPHLRGLGIGERLVREALARARAADGQRTGAAGAHKVGLLVNKKNRAALMLYRKLGFTASEDHPKDFNRSPDELWLSFEIHGGMSSRARGPGWLGFSEKSPNLQICLKHFCVNWADAIGTLAREGMFYPFYQDILASAEEEAAIPADRREKFRQAYYEHVSKGAATVRAFEQTLSALDALGMQVLVFKGPAIDFLIYDGFARPRLDLDIAVRDADMPALEKGLAGLGYTPPAAVTDDPIPEYQNSVVFATREEGGVSLHLHRHLINNMFLTVDGAFTMDMARIWQETEPFGRYSHIVTLKPEMHIVYLCEHALKHAVDQLVFLYEIGRLIAYYGERLDWGKVVSSSKESGCARIVYHVLSLVSGGVPAGVMEALQPEKVTAGEKRFIEAVAERKQERYASYPVYVAMRKGLLQKVRFIFLTVFPPGFTLTGYGKRIVRGFQK